MKSFMLLLLAAAWAFQLHGQAFLHIASGTDVKLANTSLVTDSTHVTWLGNVDATAANLKFSGPQNVTFTSNGNVVGTLEISKSTGSNVVLQDAVFVADAVAFSATDNLVVLNNADVNLLPSALVTGYNSGNYFMTNGAGYLRKYDLGLLAFEFPVGHDENTYNPVILFDDQSVDNYGVRCLANALEQGGTGNPILAGVVDASWEVVEDNPGEMNLSIDVQWDLTDELPGFDRTKCGVARWDASAWDLTVYQLAPASGMDPYQRERINLPAPGYFAVGNEAIADPGSMVDISIFLEGPYQGEGVQADELRGAGLLPVQEPYTALGFPQAGFGGGQTVNPSVFNTTGPGAVIDWLLIEVYGLENPETLIATLPALLQQDGSVVALDGESMLSLPGIPAGDYFIAVKHRNHLGVRIADPVFLSSDPVAIDFTLDPNMATGGTNGVADLGDGRYGMVSGDFDHNGQVQNTDASNVTQQLGGSGYAPGDLDLNGQIQNIDLQLKLTPNLGRGQQF